MQIVHYSVTVIVLPDHSTYPLLLLWVAAAQAVPSSLQTGMSASMVLQAAVAHSWLPWAPAACSRLLQKWYGTLLVPSEAAWLTLVPVEAMDSLLRVILRAGLLVLYIRHRYKICTFRCTYTRSCTHIQKQKQALSLYYFVDQN